MKHLFFSILTLCLISTSCSKSKITVDGLEDKIGATTTSPAIVATVSVVNDQLIINGSNLDGVTSIQVTGPSSFDQTFSIETITENSIVVNGLGAISFAVGAIFNLIITNAHGAATFPVTFNLSDDSVTTVKVLDGAITKEKLSTATAAAGEVLQFDGTNWQYVNIGNSGLNYQGNWDALANDLTLTDGCGNDGDYYIVSVADGAGGTLIDGVDIWGSGDWIICSASTWRKIVNSSTITSVFGKTGAVTADMSDLTDALITTPADGQILVYDNADSRWENFSSLLLSPATGNATFSNDVEVTGALTVGGTNVCLSDGTNCLPAGTPSTVSNGGGNVVVNASSGTDDIDLQINGSTKLKVDNTGNIGIGTATPSRKLEVKQASSVQGEGFGIESADGGTRLDLWSADSGNAVVDAQGGNLLFRTDSGNSHDFMINAGTGDATFYSKVGIGTNIPQRDLHIHDTGASSVMFTNTNSGTSTTDGFLVGLDSNGSTAAITNFETGNMQFKTSSTPGTPNTSMVITGSGNVGIGTLSPTANLEVVSSGSSSVVIQDDDTAHKLVLGNDGTNSFITGATGNQQLTLGYKSTDTSASVFNEINLGTHNAGFVNIGTVDAGGSFNKSLTVDSSTGNVGIGTTSPQGTLNIYGNDGSTMLLIQDGRGNSGDEAGIQFQSTSGTQIKTMITHKETGGNGIGDLVFALNNTNDSSVVTTASDERMRITSTGNVGIGTTTPAEKLHIAGRISQTGTAHSVYLGQEAGFNNDLSGSQLNVAIGYRALKNPTSTVRNVAIGANSMANTTTGNSNTAVGYSTLLANQDGSGNTAIGYYSLKDNIGGTSNTALGASTLYSNSTGSSNIAIGASALNKNISGNHNIGIGYYAVHGNLATSANIGLGGSTLRVATGNRNNAIGFESLRYVTTGSNNTAVGSYSGKYIADGTTANETSLNSVYLGYNAKALADGDDNEIVIGNNTIGAGSNSVVLGNTSITKTVLRGSVEATELCDETGANCTDLSAGISGTDNSAAAAVTLNSDTDNSGDGGFNFQTNSVTTTSIAADGSLNVSASQSPSSTVTLNNNTNQTFVTMDRTSHADISNTFVMGVGDNGAGTPKDYVSIGPSGTPDAFTVTESGLIGIGTNSPTESLDVHGNIHIEGYNKLTMGAGEELSLEAINANDLVLNAAHFSSAFGVWVRSSGTPRLHGFDYSIASSSLAFKVNGTDNLMNIEATGNVGIGTSAPDGKLHVHSGSAGAVTANGSTDDFIVEGSGSTGISILSPNASPAVLAFSDTMSAFLRNTHDNDLFEIATNNNGGEIALKTGSATEAMRISSSGNVGIGTSTPANILDIQSSISAQVDIIADKDNDDTDTDSFLRFWVNGGSGSGTGVHKGSIGYDEGNDTLTLAYGGLANGHLNIDSTGNVGIGTTSPTHKLHLADAGNVEVALERTSGAKVMVQSQATRGQIGTYSNNELQIVTNSNAAMTIDVTGNVGIGTTAPDSDLEVRGTAESILKVSESTNNNFIQLYQQASDSYLTAGTKTGTATNNLKIYTGGSESMIVTDTGEVGIGTSAPSTPLHVYNDVPALRLQDATSGDNHYVTGNNGELRLQTTGYLSLMPGNTTSMTLFANGNVGIGTTSPSDRLTVKATDNLTTNYPIQIMNSSDSMRSGLGTYGFSNKVGTAQNVDFTLDIGDDLVLNTGGNVGIGTSSPGVKLDVNGGVRGTSAYDAASDERFKDEISPIANSLDKIKELSGVRFVWRHDEFPDKEFQKGDDIGVIAQNVEKIFPEAVFTDTLGFKSVQYAKLVAPLIEATKELAHNLEMYQVMHVGIESRVSANERKIASLESENKKIKDELQELRNMILELSQKSK